MVHLVETDPVHGRVEHVSSGRALYEGDPKAQAIIQLQRGEDPFAVTTQMRTLWE